MNAFDKVIGYSEVKRELEQIADTLRNGELYRKLGVSDPRGLLLYGVPGVGKSLMAECLIEESGREAFTCRPDKGTEVMSGFTAKLDIAFFLPLLRHAGLQNLTSPPSLCHVPLSESMTAKAASRAAFVVC